MEVWFIMLILHLLGDAKNWEKTEKPESGYPDSFRIRGLLMLGKSGNRSTATPGDVIMDKDATVKEGVSLDEGRTISLIFRTISVCTLWMQALTNNWRGVFSPLLLLLELWNAVWRLAFFVSENVASSRNSVIWYVKTEKGSLFLCIKLHQLINWVTN